MLGCFPRTAAFVSWVGRIELERRNRDINDNSDQLLRQVLLLSVFLPLGVRTCKPDWRFSCLGVWAFSMQQVPYV